MKISDLDYSILTPAQASIALNSFSKCTKDKNDKKQCIVLSEWLNELAALRLVMESKFSEQETKLVEDIDANE